MPFDSDSVAVAIGLRMDGGWIAVVVAVAVAPLRDVRSCCWAGRWKLMDVDFGWTSEDGVRLMEEWRVSDTGRCCWMSKDHARLMEEPLLLLSSQLVMRMEDGVMLLVMRMEDSVAMLLLLSLLLMKMEGGVTLLDAVRFGFGCWA